MTFFIKLCMMFICCFMLLFPGTVLAETLTIPGTGDGTSVLRALAASFNKQNPDIQINIPKSIGSGGGVKAAGQGGATLARVARGIKSKEEKYGLTYLPFAKVPAVFFVTKDISVSFLLSEQICDIYSGKVKNWVEVGGPDLPIRVVRREAGDSTLSVLKKSFPGFDQVNITDTALLATSTPEIFKLMSDENHAIGFGPYDVAKNENVQVVSVDGRAPTFSGYPSVTTLAFVYQEKNLTSEAKRFIEFATSKAANLPIIVAGGIPLK
jgi:phosphate transport system substrate-binding protein